MDENSASRSVPYPVQITIPRPQQSSRLLALATLIFLIPKVILLVPHLVVVYFLGVLSFIAAIMAQVAVLVTGRYPETLFTLVSGLVRWQVRVNTYLLGLTDVYPPFSLR